MDQTDGMDLGKFQAIRGALGNQESSKLVAYAREQLEKHGLYKEDSDYGGMLGHAVETLIRVFAAQHHSGFSAEMTIELFNKLAKFEEL